MSEQISASQFIFTRVESEYSPFGRGGYQVVYASKELSDNDISIITNNVNCYKTADASHRRYEFFLLSDGRVVITHTILLDPRHPQYKTYVDHSERSGIPIAHALVIPYEDFALISYDPFILIENARFVSNLDEFIGIINEYGEAYRQAPAKNVEIKASRSSLKLNWESKQLQELYKLAYCARNITDDRRSISLIGTLDTIQETLMLMMCLIEPCRRIHLTFNTSTDECTYEPGVFWGVGVEKHVRANKRFAVIDTNARTIQVISGDLPEPSDMYSNWILLMIGYGKYNEIFKESKNILNITQAFEKSDILKGEWLRHIEDQSLEIFFEANSGTLFGHICSITARSIRINSQLIEECVTYLYQKRSKAWLLEYAMLPSISATKISEVVAKWVVKLPIDRLHEIFSNVSIDEFYTLMEVLLSADNAGHLEAFDASPILSKLGEAELHITYVLLEKYPESTGSFGKQVVAHCNRLIQNSTPIVIAPDEFERVPKQHGRIVDQHRINNSLENPRKPYRLFGVNIEQFILMLKNILKRTPLGALGWQRISAKNSDEDHDNAVGEVSESIKPEITHGDKNEVLSQTNLAKQTKNKNLNLTHNSGIDNENPADN